MCKELPVIPVNRVVGPNKNNQKKWRAEEEESHKGLLTPTHPEKCCRIEIITLAPVQSLVCKLASTSSVCFSVTKTRFVCPDSEFRSKALPDFFGLQLRKEVFSRMWIKFRVNVFFKHTPLSWLLGLVVSSPPATEEIGAKGREI
jgi:hypothetical protein